MCTPICNVYVRSGYVEMFYRVKTLVLCDMDLKRFPHDTQNCTIKFESWSETVAEISLEWDETTPIGSTLKSSRNSQNSILYGTFSREHSIISEYNDK